jgi:hypothetical protein
MGGKIAHDPAARLTAGFQETGFLSQGLDKSGTPMSLGNPPGNSGVGGTRDWALVDSRDRPNFLGLRNNLFYARVTIFLLD